MHTTLHLVCRSQQRALDPQGLQLQTAVVLRTESGRSAARAASALTEPSLQLQNEELLVMKFSFPSKHLEQFLIKNINEL